MVSFTMEPTPLTVVLPKKNESIVALIERVEQKRKEWDGFVLLVLFDRENDLENRIEEREMLLDYCAKERKSVYIASKDKKIIKYAVNRRIRIFKNHSSIRTLLNQHESSQEALALFAPEVWQKGVRSRLQSMGLLSLPRTRIWIIAVCCILVFLTTFFYLLPSSEVRVWPSKNPITQTANIILVRPNTEVDIPERIRTMELIPFTVTATLELTFDDISKQFIGTSAEVPITVVNNADEQYSFRKGTRFVNQAGMVFRLASGVIIEPFGKSTVLAIADDLDVYGQIIGERGNVPPALKWEIPGISPEERKIVYGENNIAGTGGTTLYRSVLQQRDLNIARKQIERELLVEAKRLLKKKRDVFNSAHSEQTIELLDRTRYENTLTEIEYRDFKLAKEFIGSEVESVPIAGTIVYTVFGFEKQYARDLLLSEMEQHIGTNKRLIANQLTLDQLNYFVISYDDNLAWVKITADLSGTEEFILDPFTPSGSAFAAKVRQAISGLKKDEALRIVKNFPEVDRVEITLWPFWAGAVPSIASHIVVAPH